MRNCSLKIFTVAAMLLTGGMASAQIPVEVFSGNKKSTLDILFFKYFRNKEGNTSKFLFFNRNRLSVDYKMTTVSDLPQFGFTEAISYNHGILKGVAPVLVAQVFNTGVFSKTGFQYAKGSADWMLFTWVVTEMKRKPGIDVFFLGRLTPKVSKRMRLFSQLELVNSLPTLSINKYSFTQRVRLGLKLNELQFGAATDVTSFGRTSFNTMNNVGVFFRYEY